MGSSTRRSRERAAAARRGPARSHRRSSERDELLIASAKRGDRTARRLLVERHLGLVKSIAFHYRDLGLPIEDLVQEGSIGLLEAIDRFDLRRESGFSTYAYWGIRRAITSALTDHGHLVRLPRQIIERRHAVAATAAALAAANGREPSAAEIAEAMGVATAAVVEVVEAPATVASLGEALTESGSPLEAVLADPGAVDPEAEILAHEHQAQIAAALEHLPPRKRLVISRHFGLDGDPETLAEVGEELHVSAQRARAIEQEALYDLATDLEAALEALPRGAHSPASFSSR